MTYPSSASPALALILALAAAAPAQAVRDPFARPALPVAAPADAAAAEQAAALAARPQLRAVMVAPDRSLANISGHILAVGEWFGDYQVTRIRERSVTLVTRGGVRSELGMEKASSK
jgi:hypothetical protein